MFKKRLFLFIIIIACNYKCIAQQAVVAAGSSISGSTGSISYSIGQIDYIAVSANSFTLSQGVLQVFNNSPVTYISTLDKLVTISVWPNPIIDKLFIKISDNTESEFSYQLFSIDGQLIETKKIFGKNATVDTHSYNSGVYVIAITQDHLKFIRFKIIKK